MLLVDTNIWLAAADRSSRQHQACAQLLIERAHELASTVPVIAETAWLLLDRAERLNQTTIATLDQRDFRIVRPAHVSAFELIPTPT